MDSEVVIPVTRDEAEIVVIRDVNALRYAYVTFLAGDGDYVKGDYVKGGVCLAKGLRKVQAAYPLMVAVLPDVPEEHRSLLVSQGCLVREIDPVLPPVGDKESPFVRAYFAVNYCKLRLLKFVEYDRMIYLDADIQVFSNIDSLFDLPSSCLYAVMDCLCEMDGQPCPEVVQWPEELGDKPPFYFNGGMFVFEPSLRTYNRLLSTLVVTPPTPFAEQAKHKMLKREYSIQSIVHDFIVVNAGIFLSWWSNLQDFLNFFFKDISKPIHLVYNLLVAMLWRHPEYVELDQVKVVHFCVAGSKPWKYTGIEHYMDRADVKMLIDRWWDIYNDAALNFTGNEASRPASG